MIIGLAGKSCSGKNLVASMLQEKGFETLDLDLTVRDIQDKMIPGLAELFGEGIVKRNGELDRKKLAQIVFSHPEKLRRLENLIYPELHAFLKDYIDRRDSTAPLVLNAAALQKGGFGKYCDRVLWVAAPLPLRLLRAVKRDRRSWFHLLKRFYAQKELKPQYFFSRVDISIIRNVSTRRALSRKVDAWVRDLPLER